MCTKTAPIFAAKNNTNASSKRSVRQLGTQSPTKVYAFETDIAITPSSSAIQSKDSVSNTAPSQSFDEKRSIDKENQREKPRRRARRVGHVRPDSSGRIGNKECHIFAFADQIEEMIAMETSERSD